MMRGLNNLERFNTVREKMFWKTFFKNELSSDYLICFSNHIDRQKIECK